jgi:hypothetical protein
MHRWRSPPPISTSRCWISPNRSRAGSGSSGGRLFSVWDWIETNDLSFIVHKTVMKLYPDDPPMFMERTPMGYHDVGKVRTDLAGAGFMEATVDTRKMSCHTPSARHPALGLIQGSPLGAEVAARDPTGLDKAVEAAAQAIAERFGPGPIEASMQALIFTTT